MITVTSLSNDPNINQVCEAYWQLNEMNDFEYTVAELRKLFYMPPQKILKIVREHSYAHSSNESCPDCSTPYKFESRIDFINFNRTIHRICYDCKTNLRNAEHKRKQDIIRNEYTRIQNQNPLSFERMTLLAGILISALIRFSANEDMTCLNEFSHDTAHRFSPDAEIDSDYLLWLYHDESIALSPDSKPTSIIMNQHDRIESFSPMSVKWLLPITPEIALEEFTVSLEHRLSSQTDLAIYWSEIEELSRELMLYECVAYLRYLMREHDFPFTPGPKTKLVIDKALDNFSVSQIYYLIWKSVSNTVLYYSKNSYSITRAQAAVTFIGRFQKMHEQALISNRNLVEFERMHTLPQSIVSHVLYNVVLKLDDAGFKLSQRELHDAVVTHA